MFDVFLSYSSKDRQVVREVAKRLRADGLRVWFDEWELKPGDSIPLEIERGLEQSRAIVVCMSNNASDSDWTQLESGTFRFRDPLNRERRLIPLRLDSTPVKGSLAQFVYIDWPSKPEDQDQAYAKLLEACGAKMQKEGSIPPHLINQKTLIFGELMIDVTEQVAEPEVRRTTTRHKSPVYQNIGKARHVLGGVFFHARFLELISKSLHIVFPFPTVTIQAMDLEDEVEKLTEQREQREKWRIAKPAVTRQPYCVRRTFLTPTQKEVLRVDWGNPEQFSDAELDLVEQEARKAIESWDVIEGQPAILFADYDLGLFSNGFIQRISKLIPCNHATSLPIVVHSGRSWRKFSSLPHAIIVSDWDEALVDFLRLDPNTDQESLAKEFDANPFPRIAQAFPELDGFVLVNGNEIRAGFWQRNGDAIAGQDIRLPIEPVRSKNRTRIGERAIVACWLCATLQGQSSRIRSLLQAAEALEESSSVLTDRLWTDKDALKRLRSLLESKKEEKTVSITEFNVSCVVPRLTPSVPLEIAIDGFPGPVVHILCLYGGTDSDIDRPWSDFAKALELQSRTGQVIIRSEKVPCRYDDLEKLRRSLSPSDVVVLFGNREFYESGLRDSVVHVLEGLREFGGVKVLALQLENWELTERMAKAVAWIKYSEIVSRTGNHRWKMVIDRLMALAPTKASEVAQGGQEPEELAAYRHRRVEMTVNLAQYYKKRFPDLCRFYKNTEIPVLVNSNWLPEVPVPVSELDSKLHLDPGYESFRDPGSEFLELLREYDRDGKLFNGLTYRLKWTDGMKFHFCLGRYFDFLRTCEFLGYEAVVEWLHRKSDTLQKWAESCSLPKREDTDPTDFASRSTAFGTCALVVVKRSRKPPLMLLNRRSQALTETPGLTHVIPAGTFQPHGWNDKQIRKEFSLSLNIFRELIEELISDEGIRLQNQADMGFPGCLTQKGKTFFENVYSRNAFELFYLGTVMDPFNLKPEILTVCIIDEESLGLQETFYASWETEQNIAKEAFTKKRLGELMTAYDFVPTGKAHLSLAARHFGFLSNRLRR